MQKEIINTKNAPSAIGTYSQAIKAGNTVYLSGQIGLNPSTMEMLEGVEQQTHQVFKNMQSVVEASGGTMQDIVKLNIYLTSMSNFAIINQVMAEYFTEPYPARAAIGVSELPKGALVEADGIVVIG
jgi:reactive intermediate/imine deaminase